MFDPTLYPYTRVQTYSDGNPPAVLADEFYNSTEDHLARLFGAMCGLSTSMACDEFDVESGGALLAGTRVGEHFTFDTGANADAQSVSPIADGDHGIWLFRNSVGGAAHNVIIRDNAVFIGARQFIWGARIRLEGRANFATRVNEGVVVGLWGAAADTMPAFRTGSDFANWWAYYNDAGDIFVDTGIPAIDDTWFNLFITRKSSDNKLRWYISTGTATPVLVHTSAAAFPAAITFARRFLKNLGTAGSAIGDGVYVDFFKRGIER